MLPLDLTIAIPTLNEEANLRACLESIGPDFAKRVVIIDSGSTDNTQHIASEYDVEFIPFCWDGNFPKKRNWFLRNHQPTTTWVLFLDADEILTKKFKEELTAKLPKSRCNGYWLNYTIYFLGQPLRGGYPLRKLALFRVGMGEYERIEESRWSNFDMEIHEHPVLPQPIGKIHSRIDHRDFRGIDNWVAKHSEYASWEAYRFLARKNSNTRNLPFTLAQRIKYKLLDRAILAPMFFLSCYIGMGGFLDGGRGLAWAILKASYFSHIYTRIKEIELEQTSAKKAETGLHRNNNKESTDSSGG